MPQLKLRLIIFVCRITIHLVYLLQYRPFNTYGPRQSTRAVIPTIINQISKKVSKVKLGSINTTRDFNFVEDTVQAYINSLKK